jgi:biotin synthase-related radical SAM superfamily protein
MVMSPSKVRVSIGTAAVLGLAEYRLDARPTTAYLMTYTDSSCAANCAFCPQARENSSNKTLLSRVLWPDFPTDEVFKGLRWATRSLERVCIQAINYPGFFDDVVYLLKGVKEGTNLPVSLDAPPLGIREMKILKGAGLERISVPLDAATPEIFERVKGRLSNGPYRWEKHIEALKTAVEVFDKGRVNSNLIVGLGETEREAVSLIQLLRDMGVQTALFAFTPVPGTALANLSPPHLEAYRRIQLARHFITKGLAHFKDMEFDDAGRLKSFGADLGIVKSALVGEALRTSGCPGCNRPYYNERPSGPIYNYPRMLTSEELHKETMLMGIDLE